MRLLRTLPLRSVEVWFNPVLFVLSLQPAVSTSELFLATETPPLSQLTMSAVIAPSGTPRTHAKDIWEDEDDDGWQEMEIIRNDGPINGMDEEDQKKYKYVAPQQRGEGAGNATGVFDDIDYRGQEWRTKLDQDENDYTRLRVEEEDESDQVHLRTRYLFDEDKAMTPLSQMQATKNLLTEAQRIAYVGLCALTGREMAVGLKKVKSKELNDSIKNLDLWTLKIMGRLYYHMDLATAGK